MSAHKAKSERIDLESINNLSADKRALLVKRLRKKPKTASSTRHKLEGIGQSAELLSPDLIEQFGIVLSRRQEAIPQAEIASLLERAKEEVTALQEKFERGKINGVRWADIKANIRSAIILLIERYQRDHTVQRLGQDFLNQYPAHNLLEHSESKFTQDMFSGNIERWKQDFGFLRGRPDLRFLEIGSFEGRSTCWLLENILTHKTSTIICIDPFTEIYQPRQEEYFDFNVERTGVAYKVTKLRGYSQVALKFLSAGSFDLIYIDGSHTAGDILQDAILSWDLLKRDGILVFDDYEYNLPLVFNPTLLQPKQAIDTFLSLIDDRHKIIHKGWQVALIKLY